MIFGSLNKATLVSI